MACAGNIAPPRKTTTYGRHSRRFILSLSSATESEFAQDAGASISDPKGITRHGQGNGRTASSNVLHGHSTTQARHDNLTRQALSTRPKPRDQLRSSPSRSVSAKEESSYDVPLSDDGLGHYTNAARKRRKVTPSKVVADKQPPVYDDESLQRHVAAEAQRSEGQSLHSPSITLTAQDSDSRSWTVKTQASARGSPNKSVNDTSKDSTVAPTHNGTKAYAFEQRKGPLGARKQLNAIPRAKFTSHGVLNTETDKTTARPTTPNTVFNREYLQEATSDLGSRSKSRKSFYQPTTPPGITRSTGGATTPRQRELWDKLLVDNVGSPSSLDLPGLIVDEKKPEDSRGHAKSRKISWGPHQRPTMLKARPTKIVETLHQSDQDQDHFSDDGDEMRGSSSSDNKSEYMQSEVSAADGAITVQTSPSADSQGLVSQPLNHPSNASQTAPSLFGGGLKVTYARQRSYLTDNDLEEAAMVALPVPPESNNRRGYGRQRLEDRVPNMQSTRSLDDEFGDLADSHGGTMRSIHELREAGGNVRLVSELEAILDDIGTYQPLSTSLRRSKLIDLVTKLEEPANCRLFVGQGLESRLMADVGSGNDLIANGLLVAALLQLITFSSSTLLLTQVGDVRVVKFLVDLLGSDQDLLSNAGLRGNNMSKAVLADLNHLCSALLRSTAWRAGKPSVLSCHVLSLQCLEYLVRQTREAGSLSEVLSAYAIRRIVVTSVPPFSTLPPQPGEISVVCLELAVSILESCTISNAAECQASLWAGETLERVIGLLPLLSLWKGEDCGSSRTLTLRLYLNLTNNSPGLCEDFSTPEVVSVIFKIVISHFHRLADSTLETDKTHLLDDLILSLGTLINLADLSKLARQLMMDLRYGSQSYLDTLLELFMNKSKGAAEVRMSSATNTFSGTDFSRSPPWKRLAPMLLSGGCQCYSAGCASTQQSKRE